MPWAHWSPLTSVALWKWQRGKQRVAGPCSAAHLGAGAGAQACVCFSKTRILLPLQRCRHNLQALRAYCLECLMHLLVAPGCTRQREEPGVGQLQWEALRWAALPSPKLVAAQ